MFECMEEMMIQFVQYIPALIGIYMVFDFTGALLFGKR